MNLNEPWLAAFYVPDVGVRLCFDAWRTLGWRTHSQPRLTAHSSVVRDCGGPGVSRYYVRIDTETLAYIRGLLL